MHSAIPLAAPSTGAPASPPTPASKLAFLESIRGLAAFTVLLTHLTNTFWFDLKADYPALVAHSPFYRIFAGTPLFVLINGNFAVRIFFVLSGFVLSLSFFRSRGNVSLTSAALRRYFRLLLPVFASVMLAWMVLKLGWFYNLPAADLMHYSRTTSWLPAWFQFRPEVPLTEALWQGIFDAFFNFNGARSLNSSLWTMPIELFGSLFVFALLALVGKLTRRWIVYLILAFIFRRTENFYLLDFLAGLALCDLYTFRQSRHMALRLPFIIPLLALLAGLFLGGLREDWIQFEFHLPPILHNYWRPAGAVLIIASALSWPTLQRFLEIRPFVFLGRISFSLYVIHLTIICSLTCWLYLQLRNHFGWSHQPSAWLASVVCLLTCLLASWGLYHIADRPSIRLGRYIEERFLNPKA